MDIWNVINERNKIFRLEIDEYDDDNKDIYDLTSSLANARDENVSNHVSISSHSKSECLSLS